MLAPTCFHKRKASKDGLQPHCKDCHLKYSKRLRSRKKFLQQNGKTTEQKAEFINELHLRRARQTTTDITSEWMMAEWRRVTHCPLCQKKLSGRPGRPTSRNLDHIVPISEGGRHLMSNVRIICRTCNLTRKYVPAAPPLEPSSSVDPATSRGHDTLGCT